MQRLNSLAHEIPWPEQDFGLLTLATKLPSNGLGHYFGDGCTARLPSFLFGH
jgi:hypothetical protein